EPIRTWNGEPAIITVANGGAGLILIGQDGSADAQISVASRFLFVRSSKKAARAEEPKHLPLTEPSKSAQIQRYSLTYSGLMLGATNHGGPRNCRVEVGQTEIGDLSPEVRFAPANSYFLPNPVKPQKCQKLPPVGC